MDEVNSRTSPAEEAGSGREADEAALETQAAASADGEDQEGEEYLEGPEGPEGPEEHGPPDWEGEAKQLRDLYLRTLAEAENTRRRFQKEREETARFASEGVLRDLLPFLDNLNLALDYADRGNPAVKSLAEGVDMTLKGCLDKLADWGLKEIEVVPGQPFDPNFQEALGQAPDPSLPDKSVGRLVAKGYTLHNRLLRPAKVMVVKNLEPGPA
jgi:molecular chaperone GrpE